MPPDIYTGSTLTQLQKGRMLETALKTLTNIQMRIVTWMSFEPLSWDVSDIVRSYPDALNWAVIGAASRGRTYYQPVAEHIDRLEAILGDWRVPVFYKGNLKRQPRREEFPI